MSDPPLSLDRLLGTNLPSTLHPRVVYQLSRRLGQGGTAMAFLAVRHSPEGQSPVVIKMILPQIADEKGDRAMTIIKKEAVALGRLNERVPPCPYVVRLVDTGSVDFRVGTTSIPLPWLALEYVHGGVEGTTLTERVLASVRTTGYAFDPARAAHCIRSLGLGLSEIHAEGVLHRDLTPGNVLCCGAGDSELFKISDFGFARPAGLAATFGDAVVGTPGYVALEQLDSKLQEGPWTDIFSLAAISYYVLTAESYFRFKSIGESVIGLSRPERRSITEAKALAPELRGREAACRAIDMALATATARDPSARPDNARLFIDSLLPWIWREQSSSRPSERWVTGLAKLERGDLGVLDWRVLHPPGDDRVVLSAAWNAAGHALCSTTRGLSYWNGTEWLPTTHHPPVSSVHFVRRLSPTSWLVGADKHRLIEYSREGWRDRQRGPDPSVTFTDCVGEFEDIAVSIGVPASGPPMLYALVGGHWLKPLPVPDAAFLTAVARTSDETWLVVGRRRDGGAFAAVYYPLAWALEPILVPPSRVLLACATRWEQRATLAVGADGVVLELQQGQVLATNLPSPVDLSAVAIDTFGQRWAASPGRIWYSDGSRSWRCAHALPDWSAPFVSLTAEVGMVCAMTADGAVLECQSTGTATTRPGG